MFKRILHIAALCAAAILAGGLGGCGSQMAYHGGDSMAARASRSQLAHTIDAAQEPAQDAASGDLTGSAAARQAIAAPAGGAPEAEPEAKPKPRSQRGATTGSRSSTSEATKPYTDAWWEQQNREDAKLRQKMQICRC